MAEEDEIDILGDFNLDNFLCKNENGMYESSTLVSQNTELLNCDYTIHPQWLLDRPSANPDNWYDGLLKEPTPNDNESLGHVSTENCITDESGWTEKEKNLLERGIEIFGKSNVRLSQFIGSRTSSEVKYYLKNFYLENQTVYKSINDGLVEEIHDSNLVSDVLDAAQIPASIEEVIASVRTAKPTIPLGSKKARKKSASQSSSASSDVGFKDIPSGQSVLKANYVNMGQDGKNVKSKVRRIENTIKTHKSKSKKTKNVKFKFKANIKMPVPKENRSVKQKTIKLMSDTNKKTEVSKVEITTGKGLSVPICEGEEIIKLKKVDDDSDEDIEIDVEDSEDDFKPSLPVQPRIQPVIETKIEVNNTEIVEKKPLETSTRINNEFNEFDLSKLDDETVAQLLSLDEPKEEVILDEQEISELEKVIHSEFFESRPTKTPSRYLKIRNHIINNWLSQKPVYVTKTSIRQGLRNCGDVNCIGRIHYFLEQFAVINFGCPQMTYIRPLYDMIQMPTPVKEKTTKDCVQPRTICDLSSRPRIKKKFSNDGEGGCTLAHDEKGKVINTTIINEEPVIKQRQYIKKPIIRLIYCRPFTEEHPQKYKIKFQLSTLLSMDFHAHTSLTEVMGLIAGYWSPQTKTLSICYYAPCKNIASSATHCDMCPISQAKAAESIHNQNLDILGWFHSHPTFAPEPSQQDLETQQLVQQWIGYSKPCIGVILSPFSLNGALIASPYRCMIVDKKENFEDQFVPYKFQVDLISDGFDVDLFVRTIEEILYANDEPSASRVKFSTPYFQDATISYLDKFISSVRMYLAKCGTLNKMQCDEIIEGITNACIE